jgi:uncharacterized protein
LNTLTNEMIRMIVDQRLAYIASVTPGGHPAVSPRGSLRVLDRFHLVFADIEAGRTAENLTRNPRVEINVVDPFARRGFRFAGTATTHRQGDLFLDIVRRFESEGADTRRIASVTVVEIASASPLDSPVYKCGFPEEEVRRLWEEFHLQCSRRMVQDLIPPNDF